jgi:transcriptional regulator with XRE-family HTH domain
MLNNKIKELREQQNLKQEELAEKLNLTRRRISTYERNESEPDIQTLKDIAKYFNISTDWLLELSDIKNRENLSVEEQQLINNFRELKENEKFQVIGFIQGLKSIKTLAKSSTSTTTKDKDNSSASA